MVIEPTSANLERCMAQRDNMRAIFNSLAEGIFTVDRDLQVTNANQALGEIVGRSANEVAGIDVRELLHGAASELQTIIDESLAGRATSGHELVFLHQDGAPRTAILTAAPLTNPDGSIGGTVIVLRDITEVRRLTEELEGRSSYFKMVGRNPRMRRLYDMIENLADNDVTVLVQGESGTGKELVAQAIHYRSHRSKGPLVRVNCSALSETLLESELFGHIKGSFTGAVRDRVGRFEEADGGTIFLDEIGDISPAVQKRLLRVLQEREFERVGESRTRQVDVRVIAATNQDLRRLVDEGHFREDLYYRLHVVNLELPALRERREDIPLLVDHFLTKLNASMGRQVEGVASEVLELFMRHPWPGNVRELENAIQHALVVARGRTIRIAHLPPEIAGPAPAATVPATEDDAQERERTELLETLTRTGWNQAATARALGVDRTTVWRRMKRFGLTRPQP